MGKCLIIGCGGVASVAIHKCCQNSEVFEEIMIASRTLSKCDALKEKLAGGKTVIHTAQVNADHVEELIALIDFCADPGSASWHLGSDDTWTRHHLDGAGEPLTDVQAALINRQRRRPGRDR